METVVIRKREKMKKVKLKIQFFGFVYVYFKWIFINKFSSFLQINIKNIEEYFHIPNLKFLEFLCVVVFLIYRFVIKKRRTNYIDSIYIDLNANMELK